MKNPLNRLKHRNIAKVASAYAIVGWLMLQLTEIVLPTFNAPQWIAQTIIFVVIMGFPIALLIAWASEIKSADNVPSAEENAFESNLRPKATFKTSKVFYSVAALSLSGIGLLLFTTTCFSIYSNRPKFLSQSTRVLPSLKRQFLEAQNLDDLNETGTHPGYSFRTSSTFSQRKT